MLTVTNLTHLATLVREHPGLRAKHDLRHVSEILGGDGDDAAVLVAGGAKSTVAAAEAIVPALVRADSYVAGIAGMVAVLNDIAASGARTIGVLDTVVGTEAIVRGALGGIRAAADRYRVPVVGGHTTISTDEVGLSTFAMGYSANPLRAANARPGDALVLMTCLDGQLVRGLGGVIMFSHLRGSRADRAADDLEVIAQAADDGVAWAARDISMPGLGGSLLQFLESAGGGLGCTLSVDQIPVPPGVELTDWLAAFPSYGFLVACDSGAMIERADRAGLTAVRIGTFNETSTLRLTDGAAQLDVWDLSRVPLAGLTDGGATV